MVLPVVAGQSILPALQGKAALGDTVGVPAHHGAHKFVLGLIVLHIVKAQDYIHRSLPPLRRQAPQGSAVSQKRAAQNSIVQSDLVHGAAVSGNSKGYSLHHG